MFITDVPVNFTGTVADFILDAPASVLLEAVQHSRRYITPYLRTLWVGCRTTRAVATHDRRPCNCVGRGFIQPRRPRRMAVQGSGPSAHRPRPPSRRRPGHYAHPRPPPPPRRQRTSEDSDRLEVDTEPALVVVMMLGTFF